MIYLVSIERKKKFERVLIEHFDSGIKECNREKLPVGTIANGQDVIGHFEGTSVGKRYNFPALTRRSCIIEKKNTLRLTDSSSDCRHSMFQNLTSLSVPPVTKAC
jgi:hypothetical protein